MRYTVRSGDTLYGLGLMFGVSVIDLQRGNEIIVEVDTATNGRAFFRMSVSD